MDVEKHIIKLKSALQGQGVLFLRVNVSPGSSVTDIVSVMDDETLKIRVKSNPEKGRANNELIDFVRGIFGAGCCVEITSGMASRRKRFCVKI